MNVKWHWVLLLAGLGTYSLIITPALLHDAIDAVVLLVSGTTVVSFAIFGFDSAQLSRRLAAWMIITAVLLAATGILLVRDGRVFMLILVIPVLALGGVGLQKYFRRE